MRFAFLSFETLLTVIWFWAAFWMFGLLAHHDGDWGTLIGGLVFLIFGVGTAAMLLYEAFLMIRQRAQINQPTAQSMIVSQSAQQRATSEE